MPERQNKKWGKREAHTDEQFTNHPAPGPRCAGLSHPQPPRGGAPSGLYKPPRTAWIPPPPASHPPGPPSLLQRPISHSPPSPQLSPLGRFRTSAFPARAPATSPSPPSTSRAPALI
ncbi:hypothetical protein GQ55_3G238600 [Panicum hallii var. hallii]|uniref:Uncharacterized protein n=1 Tax=Panicum hallii var. hallii TaxID=1504633 RepID=A0A2T7ECQ2_9POAL|nr:hypothetical protein GQ55_3G238600 [Panicum hallii var. hallii]